MEIDEALVIEELVDGESHRVADAEDGTEGVGPEAHVCDAAEILQGGVLLLERETHRVAFADDLDLLRLDLHMLAAADGSDEFALHGDGRTGGDPLDGLVVDDLRIRDDLDIVDGGAVVQGDEFHLFVASLGPDPTFGQYLCTRIHAEQLLDLDSFHIDCCAKSYKDTEKIQKSSPRGTAFLKL